MGRSVNLPADFAIDALSLEAQRRGRERGRPYSYGQLVADTTREQREEIAEAYEAAARRKQRSGGTKSFFSESDKEGGGD